MNRRTIAISVAFVVVAGASWVGLSPNQVNTGQVARKTAGRLGDNAGEARTVATAERGASAHVAQRRGPATSPSAPVAAVGPRAEAAEQREFRYAPNLERALELAKDRADLNSRLLHEMSDSSWRSETEARMRTTLMERGLDSNAVTDIDCRISICRFVVHTRSKADADVKALLEAARAVDAQTWTMPEEQEVGYSIDVYFPRAGYRLSSGGGRVDDAVAIVETPVLAEPLN
jgi:hypothetical protein